MSRLNTDFYSGRDQYSDGDVETDIIEYIKQYEPEKYSEVLKRDQRFPVFYHLSQYRQHLLDWYPFCQEGTLLEIGGGMGAFTHMFCNKCKKVVTVELSKRRAEAIHWRCRNKQNLDIFVGDLMTAEFGEQFDYVTVLGVLEYQRMFSASSVPEIDFLRKIKQLLKPGGTLFIAIENRMGLKYWCGGVEDHSGIPFTSVNQYQYGGKARTFDRQELIQLLQEGGFHQMKFYYPLPDYKFPRVLYTDEYLPLNNVNACVVPNHYDGTFHTQYPLVADERSIYPSIAKNHVFPYFANSFLVECTLSEHPSDVRFVATTAERISDYMIRTVIGSNCVYKEAINQQGRSHILQTSQNNMKLQNRGIPVLKQCMDNGRLVTPYVDSKTVEDVLIDLINHNHNQEAIQIVDAFYEMIQKSSDVCDECNPRLDCRIDLCSPILEHAYCDMIFSNAFYQNNTFLFYDQEWVFEHLPANFVLYRAIKILYATNHILEDHIPLTQWLERYGITPLQQSYDEMEKALFDKIQDDVVCGIIGTLRNIPQDTIKNNLMYLTSAEETISCLLRDKNAYQDALHQREKDVITLEAGMTRQAIDRTTLEKALNQREADVAALEAAMAQQATDRATLESALNQRETDVAALEAAIAQQATDRATLEGALSQRATDVAALEAAMAQQATDCAALERALNQRESDVAALETAMAQQATDCATLERALNQRESDVAALEAAMAQQATDRATLEGALSQQATDVAALEAAMAQQATDRAVLEDALHQQETDACALRADLTKREDQLNYLKAELAQQNEDVIALNTRIDTLNKELQTLLSANSTLVEKLHLIEETRWYQWMKKINQNFPYSKSQKRS